MSTNYTNITLIGPTQSEVVAYLEARRHTAYVSPTIDEVTVVYENKLAENSELPKPLEALLAFSARLSADFACPTLLSVVLDDDLFMYTVFLFGEMVDSYAAQHGKDPASGKPELLAELFHAEEEVKTIQAALSRDMLSATERHKELMDALVMPPMMIDMGFAYLEEGETPHGVEDPDDVIFVGEQD